MSDWYARDRAQLARIDRLQLYASAALITLALAWFGLPALALWLQGPLP